MSMYRSTFHRDGSVTIWNVYTQQWERLSARNLADEQAYGNMLMPTLSEAERARILRIAARAEG